MLFCIARAGGIHNKITNELGDCELAPINRERAVLAIVGKQPFSVATLFLRQVG